MKEKTAATLFVMVHFLIALGHGKAHSQLHIGASTWQVLFIAVVIFIGPLLAMALLWTRRQKIGFVLLLATMAGSLFFGVAYHFLVSGSDSALELHSGHWESLFRMTAMWLAVTETAAVAWCVWALQAISRVGRGNGVRSGCS